MVEIKDKIVNIKAFEWYFHIQKAYSSLREQLAGTEPEIRCKQKTIHDFPRLRSLMRGLLDDVRTAFELVNDTTIYIPTFQSLV